MPWSLSATSLLRGYVSEIQHHPLSLMNIVKANVLIDEAKRAHLADSGLLTIISDITNPASLTSFPQGRTYR